MAEYSKNGVNFSEIDPDIISTSKKITAGQYIIDENNNIISDPPKIINAIDIDWNNAQIGNGDNPAIGPIKTTSDLLKSIVSIKNNASSNGIPIYDENEIEQRLESNTLPDRYISLENNNSSTSQTLINSLMLTVGALQQEVEKLKNSFTRGIYSYNNEATFISSMVNSYGDYDAEEPLWAIDESELDEIEGVEIPENTYVYTDTNNIIKDCEDCRLYTYVSADNLNIEFTIKNIEDENSTYTISLNDIIQTDKKVNVLIVISRKLKDLHYPINFVYVSVNEQETYSKIARGYIKLETLELKENEYNIESPYYLYSIDASNANASKLNIYSQDKEVGNDILGEVPGDDEDTYRVAHIAIRSVRNTETLNNVKKKLVNNELVFNESEEKLYIKINNKLIKIGASSSSDSPDDPWNDDNIMTKQEIIKALNEQGIITVHFVDSSLEETNDKYGASNIVDYTFNKVGSVTFVNEETGKTYEFSADAHGELKGKLIEESTTFESQLNSKGKTLPKDFSVRRGFISTFNDLMANRGDSENDRKLDADRIRIGAVYAPLTTDVTHGCSHAYVELENTSDKDYNLTGCGLHIIKFDEYKNYYIKHTLKLTGTIKAGSTYLIRGKKYIINDNDPNCFIHVNTYDQEWYANNELIDLSIKNDSSKSTVFVLTYMNLYGGDEGDLTANPPIQPTPPDMLYLLNNEIDYSTDAGRNYLGDDNPSSNPTLKLCDTSTKPKNETYSLPAGLIDATIIGAGRYGLLIEKGWPFEIKSNCIYKNTFELDPAKQAYNGFGIKDSSRVRWSNRANDAQYLILNKEYIEFPKSNSIKYVSDYTPKASFENKNVCTDKTKFNPEKPNAVTVSFGENIYTTRCFNWISGSNNDEYVWIYDGTTLVGKFESYKYTDVDINQKDYINGCRRKEYPAYINNIVYCDYRPHITLDKSRTDKNGNYLDVSYPEYTRYSTVNEKGKRACGLFAATNDFYVSHKCVIEFNEITGNNATKKEYNYIVGRADKNGNPLEGHCSEVRKFTIYPRTYIPKVYQISDQQGFHWIEYQVWEAAAIRLNKKINDDLESDSNNNILPMIFNTGDLTQSGSRINEWLDYFIGGDVLFNHLEQNNIVGNNDLNGTDVQFLGTGNDDGKSNPYYFYLFNCVDVNNFFTETITEEGESHEISHYPIVNNVYIPSLYYLDSEDIRFVMVNSEITEVNCRDWFNLNDGNYNVNIYTGYTLNDTIGSEEYVANKTKSEGATYDTFTPIYTLLWHAFNDTDKKCMTACHEMPFTVITHKCISENREQIKSYRSLSNTGALIGSHLNQMTKSENGAGIYWFSRLLESSGVKLCIGGHKHTYAITYPLRENYKYTKEYDKNTQTYVDLDEEKSSLTNGPMSMGPTLEFEKGTVNWMWAPDAKYIDKNNTVKTVIIDGVEQTIANQKGDWRKSEYPWFGAEIDNQLYKENINWSKFPITYRGKDFIEYNVDELSKVFYPCIPKYNFDSNNEYYLDVDKYDEYSDRAVRYIMCQATGYKLKSNKELPTPRQKFSNIIPKTKPGDGSDTPSNNQLFPMFITYDFNNIDNIDNQSSEIHCKVKLGRITNIFNERYKFDQSAYNTKLGISDMEIEYLIDKSKYEEGNTNVSWIKEYDNQNIDDLKNNVNIYDNYGLWVKDETQMIDDIIL